LVEVLIPPPSQAPTPGFTFRVSRYPTIGKGPALQVLLEERVKTMQARGRVYRVLTRQVFSSEGPVFASILGFEDMASLQAELNNRDPKFQAFIKKAESMVARPNKIELFQMLVPFPRG